MPHPLTFAGLVLLVAALGGCGNTPDSGSSPPPTPRRSLEEVLAEKTPEWMSWEGVVATAQGELEDGRACIVIYLAYDSKELRERIPASVEGHPVRVEVSGEFQALPDSGA